MSPVGIIAFKPTEEKIIRIQVAVIAKIKHYIRTDFCRHKNIYISPLKRYSLEQKKFHDCTFNRRFVLADDFFRVLMNN